MPGTGLGAGTMEMKEKEAGPLFQELMVSQGRGPRGLWEGFREEVASELVAGRVAGNV